MIKFNDYVNLRELAAYDVGADLLGKTSLDAESQTALTAALQAFEVIMSRNSSTAAQFLNRMSQSIPEIKAILQQHGMDSFKDSDFRNSMRRAASKGNKFLTKGLGEISPSDTNDDIVMPNSSDMPSGDNF